MTFTRISSLRCKNRGKRQTRQQSILVLAEIVVFFHKLVVLFGVYDSHDPRSLRIGAHFFCRSLYPCASVYCIILPVSFRVLVHSALPRPPHTYKDPGCLILSQLLKISRFDVISILPVRFYVYTENIETGSGSRICRFRIHIIQSTNKVVFVFIMIWNFELRKRKHVAERQIGS